jgi:transcriptional/translational regulatory protein YebC/TACO1
LAVAAADADEDELMLQALDAGAADFTADDDLYEIYTAPDDFEAVKEKLEAAGYSFTEAEITMIPENTVEVTDLDDARKVVSLIEALEDHDDVQNVYTNLDLPSEVAEALANE